MIGLARGAARAGLAHTVVDMAPIWDAVRRAGAGGLGDALASARSQFADIVRREGITHVLGYASNGADLGIVQTEAGGEARPLFAALGCTHLMLWTDHPEWCVGGTALEPASRGVLSDPAHVHFVKSEPAANEVREIVGWARTHAMHMAEDAEMVSPCTEVRAEHDVSVILGGCGALLPEATDALGNDHPDAGAIDAARHLKAVEKVRKTVGLDPEGALWSDSVCALADAWLAAKRARPLDAFGRIAADERVGLMAQHGSALAWVRAEPKRYYAVLRAMRSMVDWRRNFAVAWLARRVRVGVYGCDASALGVVQSAAQRERVAYEAQSRVYATGRVALTTNAGHDEEGLTHKVFQIACSGVPCLHHETRGLGDVLVPGREVLAFSNIQQALEHIRRGDADLREVATAALERVKREHTWEARLRQMLAAANRP